MNRGMARGYGSDDSGVWLAQVSLPAQTKNGHGKKYRPIKRAKMCQEVMQCQAVSCVVMCTEPHGVT